MWAFEQIASTCGDQNKSLLWRIPKYLYTSIWLRIWPFKIKAVSACGGATFLMYWIKREILCRGKFSYGDNLRTFCMSFPYATKI